MHSTQWPDLLKTNCLFLPTLTAATPFHDRLDKVIPNIELDSFGVLYARIVICN